MTRRTKQNAPDAGKGVEGGVPTTEVPAAYEELNMHSIARDTDTGVEIRTTDESGEHAVAATQRLEFDGDHFVEVDVDEPLTPDAARLLAAALLRLADAADAQQ